MRNRNEEVAQDSRREKPDLEQREVEQGRRGLALKVQQQKKKQQEKKQEKKEDKPQEAQKRQNISREDAEKMLQALNNDEKNTQKKLTKKDATRIAIDKKW